MPNSDSQELASLLEQARTLFAQSTAVDDVKDVYIVAKNLCRDAGIHCLSLKFYNQAAELKLRAARKGGQLLPNLHLHGGDRKSESYSAGLKLGELGLSRDDSRLWHRMASLSEDGFEGYFQAVQERGDRIIIKHLLQANRNYRAKRRAKQSRLSASRLDPLADGNSAATIPSMK
jgi:hypothetical protein